MTDQPHTSKASTIEEVLDKLFWDTAEHVKHNINDRGGSASIVWMNERRAEALATIEQLVLISVIGDDEDDTSNRGNKIGQITRTNKLRAEQRQALKQLTGGKEDEQPTPN